VYIGTAIGTVTEVDHWFRLSDLYDFICGYCIPNFDFVMQRNII